MGEREGLDEHVRALDCLRLVAVAHPDPVLLERADDERVGIEAERRTGAGPPLGVAEREALELDPDRDPVDATHVDAGRDDEQLELAMGHLDAVEPVRVAGERPERAIELREARRPRAPVEVRHPEPVRRAGPDRVERREVARVEDDLAPAVPGPRRLPEHVSGIPRDGGDVRGLVVERPAERVTEDEEPRVIGPVPRPQSDGCATHRPTHGRGKAARVEAAVHRGREDSGALAPARRG